MTRPLLTKTFVHLALCVLLLTGTGCRKEAAPVATLPTAEEIEADGEAALRQVQLALAAEERVADAEITLGKQKTTGGAQLESLHVQEAKTEAAAERAKAKKALESFQALETRAGDPVYANKIKDYDNYAGGLIRGMAVYEKGGSDGPSRYRRMWEDIKFAPFNLVTSADFTSSRSSPGY